MSISRRVFIKDGAVAVLGFSALPSFLTRAVASTPSPTGSDPRVLVVLFQRGAVDGLNTVVPFRESSYYRLRPSIAIPRPTGRPDAALDLDGFFGLHPSLSPLLPLYRGGELAVVHATGSPDGTRSHFDAQDYMESGTPGVKSTEDGWLNRHLQTRPGSESPVQGVALGTSLPRILRGAAPAVAVPEGGRFEVRAGDAAADGLEAMYAGSLDEALRGAGRGTFEAIDMLRRAAPGNRAAEHGAAYPRSRLGRSLQQTARIIRANVGLEVAFVDSGGWDHHVNEGGVEGLLANQLRDLGLGLAAFHRDLGDRMGRVTLVTLSEFGRTAAENGNRGTDHGHGNCMLLLGGGIRGGKVYGRWPGLEPEQLYDGRDLGLTTDFRTVLGEVLVRGLGSPDLGDVFPGFGHNPKGWLGLMT